MAISPASFPSRTYRNSAKDQSSELCRAHIFVCLRGSIGKPLPHGDASKTAEIKWTYNLGAGGEIMWVKKSRAA